MSDIHDLYFVYVDTDFRESGSSSNFTYNLLLPSNHNFTHVCCLDALIPKSFYAIQANYNTFQLQEGASVVTVSLTPANYTLNIFKAAVATALNAASPNRWTYSVSYPSSTQPDTGMLTYSVVGNSSQPTLIFNNVLYEPFGFLPSSTNTFVSNSITSTTVINLGAETRLLIHSSVVQGPSANNVLCAINAANSIPFSTIAYTNFAPQYSSHKLGSIGSNEASFVLMNEGEVEQNLNGLNMNFTLAFFKKDNINSVIREYIKMRALKNNSHSQ